MDLKVGEEVYVCNCGPSCPCNTMSMKEGNCTCGNKMVKAKVTKVEKDVAYVQAEGWEKARRFQDPGEIYVCLRTLLQVRHHQPEPRKMCLRRSHEAGEIIRAYHLYHLFDPKTGDPVHLPVSRFFTSVVGNPPGRPFFPIRETGSCPRRYGYCPPGG